MTIYDNYKEKLKQIYEASKDCNSFKELAERSGLGKKELQDMLNRVPLMYKQLKNKFKDYASYFEEEDAIKFPKGNLIVLDTSIIKAKNLFEAIDVATEAGFKFVLTSITVKELDLKKNELRKSHDEQKRMAGVNAQKLLGKAIYDESNIIPVSIPEISLNPDDDIINAIRSNKENIVLWSGDKAMLVKARMYDISYVCVDEEIKLPNMEVVEQKDESEEILSEVVQKTIEEPEVDSQPIWPLIEEQMEELKKRIQTAEVEVEDIVSQQISLKLKQTAKEAEIDELKKNLVTLHEQMESMRQPIHEPNTSLFKVYMKDGKMYSVGKINPNTTMVEVFDAYGRPKGLKDALEIGDTILTVMMREDMSSIKVRHEQVCKISLHNNAYRLFEKRVYSIEEEELACELPEKYFLAVKKFLNN